MIINTGRDAEKRRPCELFRNRDQGRSWVRKNDTVPLPPHTICYNNSMKKPSRRALPVILLAVFLDLISNGILIPVVPQLLANPNSPYYLLPAGIPIAHSYVLLGILIAITPIILFFSTPILGEYSDYHGRKKVLVSSLTGTALSFAIFALGVTTKSLTLLFLSRIICGIAGGSLSVAQAAIADITPIRERASRFGLIAAAYGVGFIVGPVIGGLFSDPHLVSWFNASTPFWFATILSSINALLIYWLMTETRPIEQKTNITWYRAIVHIVQAYGMKSVRMIFVTNFLFQSGIALLATFFSVFLINNFVFKNISPNKSGNIISNYYNSRLHCLQAAWEDF